MRGKSVWIDFDGVYRDSTVYLNGQKLGHQSSGYMGFRYDLSDRLEYGKPNVIAVSVDPRQNEGWWYEGGGIYRHVWLNVASPVHIEPDGVFVRSTIGDGAADVKVDVSLANDAKAPPVEVRMSVFGPDGASAGVLVARNVSIAPDGTGKVAGTLPIRDPKLWDLGKPNLYRVVVTLLRGKVKVDEQTVKFGIRNVRWDAEKGFLLNGRPVKLQGPATIRTTRGLGSRCPTVFRSGASGNSWTWDRTPTGPPTTRPRRSSSTSATASGCSYSTRRGTLATRPRRRVPPERPPTTSAS